MPRPRVINFEVLNAREISEYFVELGRVPQKSVKKAARAGATLVKRRVSSSAQLPVKYGFLRSSLVAVQEKRSGRNTGLSVFQVTFNERYNSIFQKEYKGTPRRGSANPKSQYYYPASMEYGFANLKGGVGGHYFLKSSAIAEQSNAQDKMLEVISKDIDAIKKGR
ncbi:HK97 gp10 family phage protein [Paenibacillus sp. Soil724D2]|uniref:HK97 gp10 family phage protein n=1 Tax=Paenibacillus sp. (strain Soil724D2) TaxID=1736392 RepID=UPI0007134521|nr:HK97 gp10 family phage protein [Paenibacillus sp. Soil724D2]KRE33425.1 hypothetical protein ASG85_14255 [Paenibacillus sp. Soil724D2]